MKQVKLSSIGRYLSPAWRQLLNKSTCPTILTDHDVSKKKGGRYTINVMEIKKSVKYIRHFSQSSRLTEKEDFSVLTWTCLSMQSRSSKSLRIKWVKPHVYHRALHSFCVLFKLNKSNRIWSLTPRAVLFKKGRAVLFEKVVEFIRRDVRNKNLLNE